MEVTCKLAHIQHFDFARQKDMETNLAYDTIENQDYEPMNKDYSEYANVSSGEKDEHIYASPTSQENNQTETKEKKQSKKSARNCQTRKCTLIATTVTQVITLLVAIIAFITSIVALSGQESISIQDQQRVHMEWAQQTFTELQVENNRLKSQVDTLAAQISNTVIARLSQNCKIETQVCNIEPTITTFYWRSCFTSPRLLINKTVSIK